MTTSTHLNKISVHKALFIKLYIYFHKIVVVQVKKK